MASWALANDVAVGEELARHLITILLLSYLLQLTLVIEGTEEVGGELVVYVAGGAAVDIERDTEVLKGFLYHLVVTVNHLLNGDALFLGAYGDRHAVLVTAADEEYVTLLQAQVTHVDVCRYIYSCQMAYVHSTVGVRKRRGDGGAVVFLFFHCRLSFLSLCKVTKK